MKKLFQKDEIWFAVIWILVYVLGISYGIWLLYQEKPLTNPEKSL